MKLKLENLSFDPTYTECGSSNYATQVYIDVIPRARPDSRIMLKTNIILQIFEFLKNFWNFLRKSITLYFYTFQNNIC